MREDDAGGVDAEAEGLSASMRQRLIEVTQQEISRHGFTGVSLRSIAGRAEVDPSLVRHYFGSKQNLLLQAMHVSIDSEELAADVLRGKPGGAGRRTVKVMLSLWDNPRTAAKALVRFSSALSSAEAIRLSGGTFICPFFRTIAAAVSPDQVELRAALVAGQMVGVVIGRYLVNDPFLAGSSQQDLVRIIGHSVQLYLTGPLSVDADRETGGHGTNHGHDTASISPATSGRSKSTTLPRAIAL